MKRVKTGIGGLDKLIEGGLPFGRTLLVSGKCGSGKTLFAAQFIQEGLKLGEPGVFITFEEQKDKLIENTKSINIDFKKYEQKGKLKIIGGALAKVLALKNKTDAAMKDILNEISEVIDESKAQRFVLDSTNLFTMLFENKEEKRILLANLVNLLREKDCTAMLTCEIQEDSRKLSWHGFENFVTDGVILLHRVLHENSFKRGISIIKMRGTSHCHSIKPLEISRSGIKVLANEDFLNRVTL